MTKSLLISTTNFGKQAEMLALLKTEIGNLRLPQDLSLTLKITETGSTYTENAYLKATAFCKASGLPSLADDTGLEVNAIDGAPGLFSARFSPKPNASDADRRALLISKLLDTPRPWKARFVCAMVLALPDGSTFQSHGFCEGEIIPRERGNCGFGYDPIFLCKGTNLTMAELSMEEKNHISHRAKAAKAIIPFIRAAFN
ncbi:MAG: RdgB/HAM1 family non-canonical purine NTP pyrophosphatase [Pelolinea sp.]|nr:RdgB/HAM1 family non-canonical purine NTP pyrophosphatase [Pelolinea sp.]